MTGRDDDGPATLTHPVIERLFARIDNHELLHQIHLDVVAHRGETRAVATAFDVMSKVVFGNGTPGLKTQVDRLVQDQVDRRWRERLLWGVVLTMLSGLVLLIIQTHLIGGRP